MFISSTAETRESKGEGVVAELKSMGPGVGIGTLKTRTENQRVAYATRRWVKTSMLMSITRERGTLQCWASGSRMMKAVRKRRSGERSYFYTLCNDRGVKPSVPLPRDVAAIFIRDADVEVLGTDAGARSDFRHSNAALRDGCHHPDAKGGCNRV